MIKLLIAVVVVAMGIMTVVECGVDIPGHGNGPTPFQQVFATGFSGSYNTYGTGWAHKG
jgi:hypothetical protein